MAAKSVRLARNTVHLTAASKLLPRVVRVSLKPVSTCNTMNSSR